MQILWGRLKWSSAVTSLSIIYAYKSWSVQALVQFDLEVELSETLPDVPEIEGNLAVLDNVWWVTLMALSVYSTPVSNLTLYPFKILLKWQKEHGGCEETDAGNLTMFTIQMHLILEEVSAEFSPEKMRLCRSGF